MTMRLTITLAAMLLSTAVHAGTGWANGSVGRSHVVCAGGRSFDLQQSQGKAAVTLEERVVHLTSKPSSFGKSYSSVGASLIIDGSYVAFVLDDDAGFQDCHVATIPAAISLE